MAEHQEIERQSNAKPIYAPADAMAYAVGEMVLAIYSALPAKRKRIALANLEAETAKIAALTNVYRLRCAGSVKLHETRRQAAPVLDSIIESWREELNTRDARARVDGRS